MFAVYEMALSLLPVNDCRHAFLIAVASVFQSATFSVDPHMCTPRSSLPFRHLSHSTLHSVLKLLMQACANAFGVEKTSIM